MERTAPPLLRMALLAGVLLGTAHTAGAQSAVCNERIPSVPAQAAMFDVAWVTGERLDALDNVDVVIAARGGQDLSRYGLRHSHLAFLLREADGRWRAIHLLNRCKTDHSQLYREGLGNFIGESGGHTDLRIGVPTPAVRAALKAMLAAPAIQPRVLHEPKYNVVAYPFATDYQNSNQWILEVLAAAMAQANGDAPIINRSQAQQWLRTHDYLPSKLHLGLGKRLGARLFVANATTTDHPAGERISGNYSVVTVESVFDFLRARDTLQQELAIPHVKVDGAAPPAP
ncbi:DUF2145 domain-containing protein [Stenotrophomonas sp. 24(2023)]|uniref:DUF2145 domain-containing protein n=1 Tax=Stenotrophomonas sp. 24(2023) TaxID=3068324 RepID=UPI0027DF43C6|nr:DUF2145 domain-containing protein [Stenotrophomonas sp. 24(2023)]WMJ67618.1 DUF2145 domain-containing protein [Stenotrophomonas sp. 24(2023)]